MRRTRVDGRDRRILGIALTASVLLHVGAFLLIRFRVEIAAEDLLPPPPPTVRIAPAMQAFDIIEVDAPDVAPIDVQIRDDMEIAPIAAPEPAVTTAAPPVAPERQPGTSDVPVSERLRYRNATPDVWRPATEAAVAAVTPEEAVEARIAAQINAYNDSVAAAAEAAAAARDWTVTDADGGRWGVSPGKIHLGDITLPLPFGFAPPAGRREEIAGRVRTWNEIQTQAARIEVEETVQDRVKALRERRERERARRMGNDTTKAGGG